MSVYAQDANNARDGMETIIATVLQAREFPHFWLTQFQIINMVRAPQAK